MIGLLVTATNPFALFFVLPALHMWLLAPAVRAARVPAALAIFAAGLAGPLIVLGSLAWRFGLGLDAPWYLLELVGIGYVARRCPGDRARRRGGGGASSPPARPGGTRRTRRRTNAARAGRSARSIRAVVLAIRAAHAGGASDRRGT